MSNQTMLLALHQRLIAGDNRANSKIVEAVINPLVAIVVKDVAGLHDRQDAEQMCFDALFDYFLDPAKYNPAKAGLVTYLAAIAKGKARTLRRSQSRRVGHENAFASAAGETDEPPENADEAAVLDRLDWEAFGGALIKDPGDEVIIALIKQSAQSPAAVAQGIGLATDAAGLAEAARRIERIRVRARRLAERSEA